MTHHDQHANISSWSKVIVKNMHPGPDWIPAVIAQQLGPVSFLVDVESGLRWKRHIDYIRELADLYTTHQANSQTSDDTDAFVSSSMSSASDNQGQAHVPQSALTPSVAYSEDSNQGSRYPTLVASCDNFGFVKDCIIETLNSISLSVQQHKYRVLYTQRL